MQWRISWSLESSMGIKSLNDRIQNSCPACQYKVRNGRFWQFTTDSTFSCQMNRLLSTQWSSQWTGMNLSDGMAKINQTHASLRAPFTYCQWKLISLRMKSSIGEWVTKSDKCGYWLRFRCIITDLQRMTASTQGTSMTMPTVRVIGQLQNLTLKRPSGLSMMRLASSYWPAAMVLYY